MGTTGSICAYLAGRVRSKGTEGVPLRIATGAAFGVGFGWTLLLVVDGGIPSVRVPVGGDAVDAVAELKRRPSATARVRADLARRAPVSRVSLREIHAFPPQGS